MKVLSLLQPWASLVVMGAKKIETRSWNTKYRGPLLIHASLGKKPAHREITMDFQQEFYSLQIPKYEDLPFGAIIGSVNLRHCVKSEYCFEGNKFEWTDYKCTGQTLTAQEIAFGDYSPERYGWLLTDACRFKTPIPAKGALSIWEFDFSTVTQ